MGGGYRRKADQDTLGRNSRIRYTTYAPFDKRMIPANSARIYANTNKPKNTNNIPGNLGNATPPAITGATFTRGGDIIETYANRNMNIDITSITGGNANPIYTVKYELEMGNAIVYRSNPLSNFTNVTKAYIIQNFVNQNLHVTIFNGIFEKRRLRFIIQDGFNADFVSQWSDPFTYSPKIELTQFTSNILYLADGIQPNDQFSTVFHTGASANLALELSNLAQTGATEFNQPFNLIVQFQDQAQVTQELIFTQSTDFNTITTAIAKASPSPGLSVGLVEDETLTNFVILIDPVNWPAGVPKSVGYGYDGLWDKTMPDLTTFRIDSFTSSFTSSDPHTTYNLTLTTFTGARLNEVGATLGFNTEYTVLRNGASAVIINGPTTGATTGVVGTPGIDPNSTPYNPTFLQNISRVTEIEGPVRVATNTNVVYRSFLLANHASQFYLPPKVTAFTADIDTQNATNESYDVRLTGFTGFTAFINNENKEYIFDVIFKNGATVLHTASVTWNTVTNATLPYVLYTTDRAGADANWWTHTSAGTHTIEIVLKYNFLDPSLNINQQYTLQTLTNAATLTYYEYEILNLATLTDPSTGNPVVLPYHIGIAGSNKAFDIATASQFSYLPTSQFSWECEWELDISKTGSVHDVGIDFGPPNNAHATYYGWSFLKQGGTPYHFVYPQGTFNILNFGGNTLTAATLPYTPGGTYPQNTLRWVCRYDHTTHTVILWLYLNNTLLTGFPSTRTYNSNQLANMPNGPYEYAANVAPQYLTLSHTSFSNTSTNSRDEQFRSCIVRRTSL